MSRQKSVLVTALAMAIAWGSCATAGHAADRSGEAATVPMAVETMQYLGDGQGWVSDGRHILFTRDGGKAWSDITPAEVQGPIAKIQFASARVGALVVSDVSRKGTLAIQSTVDGGENWSVPTVIALRAAETAPQILSLTFTNEQTGWLVAKSATQAGGAAAFLYRTDDGGRVWQQLPVLPAAGRVAFTSPNDGRLSTGESDWQTRDGGLTWHPAHTAKSAAGAKVSEATEALDSALTGDELVIDAQFAKAGQGWAVVLGGFCDTDASCIQYSRLWAVDGMQAGRDITPQVTARLSDTQVWPPNAKALPQVSMASVVIQSQVEPRAGNEPGVSPDADVRHVQSALNARTGISTEVDGWFGVGTAADYATFQRQLGYSGLDANGIPGPSSLATLGSGRFVLTSKILVGGLTTFTGKKVNTRTRTMLLAAQNLSGRNLSLTQGSYNPGGVGASGGTHDGGGAVDISVSGMSQTTIWRVVKALRQVGFAAWYRPPSSSWGPHIHAMAIGDTDMQAPTARDQIADYYLGKNGLANHGPDNTPSAYRVPFTWWEKTPYD